MASYKELIVWQKALELAVKVYEVTKKYPKEEMFGITSHMRRASVSISSNIAEGSLRGSKKEYTQFLCIALGSSAELESQLLLSEKVGLINHSDYITISSQITEVMKILNVIIRKLSTIN